jgi:uncharacterized protein (DUF302 family)
VVILAAATLEGLAATCPDTSAVFIAATSVTVWAATVIRLILVIIRTGSTMPAAISSWRGADKGISRFDFFAHHVDEIGDPQCGSLARVAGILALTAVVSLWSAQAMAVDGMITVPSSHGPIETINKFEAEVNAKGMIVFARIDHAAGAAAVGLSLRPTELLIFGNAMGGTPLMQSAQTIGIDLPLKALVWQDQSGSIWLSYNDPGWLAKRHGLGALRTALDAMSRAATAAR